MESASKSGLFTYKEGKRKLFDFSCDLKKDWSKIISGQTLWRHDRDGVDKDLRTLVTEKDIAAAVYIARHSQQNKVRLAEVTESYRNAGLEDRLSRLRVFWIPGDFDADNEKARETIFNTLKQEMTEDLLLQVALGGLTRQDVTRFAASKHPGRPITLLSFIREYGYRSISDTGNRLGFTKSAVREETDRLFIIGLIESDSLQGGIYRITDSGNAILDICSRLCDYLRGNLGGGNRNKELEHVCRILGIHYPSIPHTTPLGIRNKVDLQNPTALLLQHVAQADADGSVTWPQPYFALPSM
ncbi:hypothetical protein ACIQNG_07035 [Streptomyces sp. NPDC091377]|uniref:hypothetical protein n=1 Tax=Streptomyces sp. NPDC091377 TaxID=3365995 RepID=UPI003817991F